MYIASTTNKIPLIFASVILCANFLGGTTRSVAQTASNESPCKGTRQVLSSTTSQQPDRSAAKFLGQSLQAGSRSRAKFAYIAPQRAAQAMAEKTAWLVDVRASKDFQRYHIRNSLNIPGFAIKTKPYLKATTVILVDQASALHRLETRQRALRTLGFDVRILAGGLLGWHHQVGALTGDLLAQKELWLVTPRDYFIERSYRHWRPVQITTGSDKPLSGIPKIVNPTSAKTFQRQLKRLFKKHRKTAQTSPYLLLFNKNGEYAYLQSLLVGSKLNNVFFLVGGHQGYQQFLGMRAAMIAYIPASAHNCGAPG